MKNIKKVKDAIVQHINKQVETAPIWKPEKMITAKDITSINPVEDEDGSWFALFGLTKHPKLLFVAMYDATDKTTTVDLYKKWATILPEKEKTNAEN